MLSCLSSRDPSLCEVSSDDFFFYLRLDLGSIGSVGGVVLFVLCSVLLVHCFFFISLLRSFASGMLSFLGGVFSLGLFVFR